MSLIKYLYKRNSLRRKILDIEDNMSKRIALVCPESFWIWSFGAFNINPRHLAFWICVKSDAAKLELKSDVDLQIDLRNMLAEHNYPEEARPNVYIDFESQETVDRESQGNWYAHLK